MTWHPHPFVRWLLPLLIGIVAGVYIDQPVPWLTWPALALFGLAAWWVHRHRHFAFQRLWFGLAFTALLMVAGYERAVNHHQIHWTDHYAHIAGDTCWLVVRVAGEPRWRRSVRLIGKVEAAGTDVRQLVAARGKVLLYLQPDSLRRESLWWGDKLLVYGVLRPLEPPANPAAFDFRRHMQLKNVHYRMWVASDKWRKVATGSTWSLRRQAMRLRAALLQRMAPWFASDDTFGVAAALVLGYREALGAEVRATYADAGAMHILAVSGLHVGLVLWLFHALLQRIFFFRTYQGRWLRILILLGVLWAFALLTGLSPSVCRAATMFSFFLLARLFEREVFVWNVLAASAFILLVIDPFLLLQPGFQLSYLALAGILAFQPWLAQWWQPTQPALRYGWSLLTLSVAAQLGTAPVSMYYFHQFPVLFALSGLIAVPGAFVLLCLGLGALACDLVWTGAGGLLGQVLAWCTAMLNKAMAWVQALPASTIHHIWIQERTLWLIYGALVLLGLGLYRHRLREILVALSLMVVAAVGHAHFRYQHYASPEWIAFHVRGHTVIGIAHRGTLWLWHDGASESELRFATEGYKAWKGIHAVRQMPLEAPPFEASWGRWTGRSWILPWGVASRSYLPKGAHAPMPWVCVVGADTELVDRASVQASSWVLDTSLHPAASGRWRQHLEALRADYHELLTSGAWLWP